MSAAPLVRRRLRLPPPVVTAAAAAAPLALSVAVRRSGARRRGLRLQMYAYVATYQMPNDDPERLRARVHVAIPCADRAIGLGELPGLRLQRRSRARGRAAAGGRQALVWCHWVWFLVPHGTAAYLLARRRTIRRAARRRSTRSSTSA